MMGFLKRYFCKALDGVPRRANLFMHVNQRPPEIPKCYIHHPGGGPRCHARLTNADIAFRFMGIVSLDYTKVMGALLSIIITAAFIFGPAVVEYL